MIGIDDHRAPVLYYDGDCAYCNGWVRWLLRRDEGGRLQFAMLQGVHGAALLARYPELAGLDSIILLERAGGTDLLFARSDASVRLMRYLGFPWSLLALVAALPRPLRDGVYDAVGRHRYRWFGRALQCPVLTAAQRRRFLDGLPTGSAAPDG